MRLYLQTRPSVHGTPRYVQIVLQEDLLGGWTLYRESGVKGGKATLRTQQFLERQAAVDAMNKLRDAQLKRGYRLLSRQGFDVTTGQPNHVVAA